ncbi:unnamed protein product, partial [Gulo gulo]
GPTAPDPAVPAVLRLRAPFLQWLLLLQQSQLLERGEQPRRRHLQWGEAGGRDARGDPVLPPGGQRDPAL